MQMLLIESHEDDSTPQVKSRYGLFISAAPIYNLSPTSEKQLEHSRLFKAIKLLQIDFLFSHLKLQQISSDWLTYWLKWVTTYDLF